MASRTVELKQALDGITTDIKSFMDKGIKIEGKNVTVSEEDAGKVRTLFKQAQEIKFLLDVETFGSDVAKLISGKGHDLGDSAAVASNAQGYANVVNGLGRKTLGEMFVESEAFTQFKDSGSDTMRQPWKLDTYDVGAGKRMQQKDIYGDLSPHTVNMGIGTVVQFDPMIPRQQRPNRVRDLFPVATTSANLIDYFRVTGFIENNGDGNAQMVPDRSGSAFGLKPQSQLTFESDQAPVRTIAHWEAAHRHVIQDVPQLQATINNELLYGLSLVEDDQILNGDGTGENLRGILQTPGIQTYTAANNEIRSDSLRKASTLAVLANYAPTGYVLHPNDWEQIELQKGSGDGQYMLVTNIAVGVNAQVWRQPVVETPAMQEFTFLNGAFGIGAQLYDRQQASIRIAEQHADFFIRNAVVILCEERLALSVKRPESFVYGNFDT